jgi:metal-responsive CopG/Arc/MetJ family transcriptional regulator
MTTDKVAITIDREVLKRLDRLVAERRFPNRSRATQDAVEEKFSRLEHGRLAKEAAKLDRCLEQSMPEEGMQREKERPEL